MDYEMEETELLNIKCKSCVLLCLNQSINLLGDKNGMKDSEIQVLRAGRTRVETNTYGQ